MSDNAPNFDFLDQCDDGTLDSYLADYSFDMNNDIPIEDNLSSLDRAVEGAQQTPVPEVSTAPQLEATVTTTPPLSNEIDSLPQFIDPQNITCTAPSLLLDKNIFNGNDLNMMQFSNGQSITDYDLNSMMTYGYGQNFAMMDFPIDANNIQFGFNQYDLNSTQWMLEQPMTYQNVPLMDFAPQTDGLINSYINQQQGESPPMSRERSPQHPMHSGFQPELSVIHETSAQGPVRQSPTPAVPKPTRKGRRTPGGRSPNSSSLPTGIDRSRHSKQPPSAGTKTTQPRPKRPTKNNHGIPLRNDRIPRKTHGKKGNINIEPELYYGPSPQKPQSWGPRDSKGQHLFQYTEKGELAAGLYLTPRQMRWYLIGPGPGDNFDPPPRLPGVKLATRKVRQGLTLWIGWPAAQANSRYPRGGESTKCRFAKCQFSERNTIALGEPWVILDERQNVDGEMIDPFHNAGYVHLYCLEHHFDLIHLWHLLDIRADYRSFKRESHPYFSLEYKLNGVDYELRTWWIATYEKWWAQKREGKRRERDHDTSLSSCLVDFKLEREPTAVAKSRAKRKGIDMAKHRGDPELKRKYRLYKHFGLLDENGYPTSEAAAKLEYIESMQGQMNNTSSITSPPLGLISPPQEQQLPMWNNQQAMPTHNTAPGDPSTNLVHRPLPQSQQHPLEAPIIPSQGQKRGREDITDATGTTNNMTPSPKRQRLQTSPLIIAVPQTPPTSTQPNTVVFPIAPVAPIGNADVEMHGESFALNTELTQSPFMQLPYDMDMDVDVDMADTALNSLIDQFFEPEPNPNGITTIPTTTTTEPAPDIGYNTEVSRPPSSSTAPPESSPTFSSGVEPSSDDLEDLFGNDPGYETPATPPPPPSPLPALASASPQKGGSSSPTSEGSSVSDGIQWEIP